MEFRCRLVSAAGEIVEGTYAAESEARLRLAPERPRPPRELHGVEQGRLGLGGHGGSFRDSGSNPCKG